MSALIIAPGLNPALEALNRHNPASLLPLVDRPFIQHLVEFVIEGGTTRFEFVISHLPEKMEKFLEDGSRWGSQFVFHLAQDPFHPYEPLKSMEFPAEQYLLLAHGDRLPQIDLQQAVEASTGNPSAPTFWFEPTGSEDPSPAWTGWAWIPGQFLQDLPSHLDEKGLEKHLLQRAEGYEIRIQVK